MPRPGQAVNRRGYPGVGAGAIELDIEDYSHIALSASHLHFNMTPPTKIYYLIRQLQEPRHIGNPRHHQDSPLGIYQLYLLTQARYVQYLWSFYDSIVSQILIKYPGMFGMCIVCMNGSGSGNNRRRRRIASCRWHISGFPIQVPVHLYVVSVNLSTIKIPSRLASWRLETPL